MIKRLIGKMANYYPRHFFYASSFGAEWDFSLPNGTSDNPHKTQATTALLATAVAIGKHIKDVGGSATATYTTVTSEGKDIGSFRVTVERIE